MEHRQKSSSLHAHFKFYPNQNFEGKAVQRDYYVGEPTGNLS